MTFEKFRLNFLIILYSVIKKFLHLFALCSFLFRFMDAFEASKRTYGQQNCFLLKINTRSPTFLSSEHLVDPWSQFMSTESSMVESKSSPDLDAARANLEVGREAQEPKLLMNDHPLSPINEDLSLVSF